MTHRSAKALAAAFVLMTLAVWPGRPAHAQVESREGIALQNQILELRRQMQVLQEQSGRGGGPSPTYLGRGAYPPAPPSSGGGGDLVAQLLSRVATLEEQVRQLRGQIDEMQNQVQRQNAELGKRIEDMAFQTQNPSPAGPRPMPPQPTPPPSANLPLLPPPSSLGGPGVGRRGAAGWPGPAHAGAGHPGRQCGARATGLSRCRSGGARGAVRQPHIATGLRRAVPARPGADGPAAVFPGSHRLRRRLQSVEKGCPRPRRARGAGQRAGRDQREERRMRHAGKAAHRISKPQARYPRSRGRSRPAGGVPMSGH